MNLHFLAQLIDESLDEFLLEADQPEFKRISKIPKKFRNIKPSKNPIIPVDEPKIKSTSTLSAVDVQKLSQLKIHEQMSKFNAFINKQIIISIKDKFVNDLANGLSKEDTDGQTKTVKLKLIRRGEKVFTYQQPVRTPSKNTLIDVEYEIPIPNYKKNKKDVVENPIDYVNRLNNYIVTTKNVEFKIIFNLKDVIELLKQIEESILNKKTISQSINVNLYKQIETFLQLNYIRTTDYIVIDPDTNKSNVLGDTNEKIHDVLVNLRTKLKSYVDKRFTITPDNWSVMQIDKQKQLEHYQKLLIKRTNELDNIYLSSTEIQDVDNIKRYKKAIKIINDEIAQIESDLSEITKSSRNLKLPKQVLYSIIDDIIIAPNSYGKKYNFVIVYKIDKTFSQEYFGGKILDLINHIKNTSEDGNDISNVVNIKTDLKHLSGLAETTASIINISDDDVKVYITMYNKLPYKYRNNSFVQDVYNKAIKNRKLTKNQQLEFEYILNNWKTRYEAGLLNSKY